MYGFEIWKRITLQLLLFLFDNQNKTKNKQNLLIETSASYKLKSRKD